MEWRWLRRMSAWPQARQTSLRNPARQSRLVGATTWERCCLALPSLVISIVENQRPACEALAKANSIAYLGHKEDVTAEQLRHGVQTLLDDAQQRQRLSAAGAALVDGSGARRVSLAMQRFPTTRMP
jgi:UDP-N-acetylglucosamine:LPS N-acetylglucosamine transferase